MTRSIPVATEDCVRRVQVFADVLANLCDLLSLELVIDANILWVVDSKRSGSLNPEWPYAADIKLPKCKVTLSKIDESGFPEDFASLTAARAEGRDW